MTYNDRGEPVDWRIINTDEGSDGVLYWSNDQGWVTSDDADLFTSEEARTLNLPMGGTWIRADIDVVPDIPCPNCGAAWGHHDPRLDYPNRPKVSLDGGVTWDWRCYNPLCSVGYYNPETGEVEYQHEQIPDLSGFNGGPEDG